MANKTEMRQAPQADPEMEQAPQVDPKLEKEANAYITGLSKMMHSRATSSKVLEMLKGGPPEQVIPQAALTINGQMEAAVSERSAKPPLEVLLNAGVFIVNDLIEIGNAAGIFQIEGEEQIGPILQDTMQQYIEAGLADGSIDPVELQQKVEPLMTEEHRALGMEAAGKTGIPNAPNQNTAMSAYGKKMERKGAMKGGM